MTCQVEIRDGVGLLTLDRPRAINALTIEMMRSMAGALSSWAMDDSVERVELRGAGDRGLCSGADVRSLRQTVLDGGNFLEFFEVEYALNAMIVDYPKPYHAMMTGITMGGGLGISAHGSRRFADESSRFAMPETIIGFHPDVGMLWLLAQAPGEVGTHLALTGDTFGPRDALYVGIVDQIAPSCAPGTLAADRDWIDECYVGDSAAEIVGRLENHAEERARAAAELLRSRCPLSVAVSLAAIRNVESMKSVHDVLAQDYVLAKSLIAGPDFLEGVRAQLVDKDRNPRWQHARIEDVTADEVAACFVRRG